MSAAADPPGAGPPADPPGAALARATAPSRHHDKRGSPFVIRTLEPSDRAALEAFYAEFEPKRTAQGLPPEGDFRVRRWLDGILTEGVHLAVEMEDRLVGHAFLMPTRRPGVWEYAIFLHQDVRGAGVGTTVNRVTVETARLLGIARLWLSVEPHNRAAVRSYEKVGFGFRPETLYSPEMEMEMVL